MLTLNHVTLKRGTKVLLHDVSLAINPRQRIGLIGANGCGKSTLFALLLNKITTDAGDYFLSNHVRIAHLAQETPALTISALDYVLLGDEEYCQIMTDLKAADINQDGLAVAHAHELLAQIDGYKAEAKAGELLHGLGFNSSEQQKSVKDFSGGWRMRLNLAQALMCRSDLLLLDEPTNHLDLDAIIWLEKFLLRYDGTLIIISHDREFLDNITTHIVHIEHQQLNAYTGNYSHFESARAEKLTLQQAMFEKQQRKRTHLEQFVNRFRAKASKAKQAQSRLKMLEKMPNVAAVQADSPFQFEFKTPEKLPNPLLVIENGSVKYAEQIKPVLTEVNISVAAQARIGILGRNGAGKSTLMKTLAREMLLLTGDYHANAYLKIGYFAQHQLEQLNPDATPIQHLQKIAYKETNEQLRTFLGGFGFIGDEVFATVKHFSGGEKARLVLALIVWQKPNLLLLDEPTNHFDIEMREALTLALQDYVGALIVVSHDRFLLQATVDEYYLVDEGQVQPFIGDLSEYAKWLLEDKKNKNTVSAEKKQQGNDNNNNNQASKNLMKQIKQLEKKLADLTEQKAMIQYKLADENLYQDGKQTELIQLTQQQTQLEKLIAVVEEEWLQAQGNLEQL